MQDVRILSLRLRVIGSGCFHGTITSWIKVMVYEFGDVIMSSIPGRSNTGLNLVETG